MKKLKSLLIIIALVSSFSIFIAPVSADAVLYYVDSDTGSDADGVLGTLADPFLTIQHAIDKVADGDDGFIRVAAGTYTELLEIDGKNISLTGAGASGDTISKITGTGLDGTVISVLDCSGNVSISGFEITEGNAIDENFPNGGGISIKSSADVHIDNCFFHDNNTTWCWGSDNNPVRPSGYGGGLYVTNSTVSISQCDFEYNTADYGGGIDVDSESELGPSFIEIDRCSFDHNRAYESGYGGAIYMDIELPTPSPDTISITDCSITYNSAGQDGGAIYCQGYDDDSTASFKIESCYFNNNFIEEGKNSAGGAIYLYNISATILNCSFFNNNGQDRGGAIYLYDVSLANIYNCTFFNNVVIKDDEQDQGWGHGICAYNSSSVIKNCIMGGTSNEWDADATQQNQIYGGLTFDVSNSDIEGGYTGSNNIKSDPLFVNPVNGDLHLKDDSPCIDVGADTSADGVTDDIDGDPRTPGPGSYDIGADEYTVDETDLSITKTVSFPWAYAGSYMSFTLTVANNGADATGVEVTDVLPAGLAYLYSIPSQGTYDGATWAVGNMDDGAQETLEIIVRVNARGFFVNTATVSGNEDDSAMGNNTDQATLAVLNRRAPTFISIVNINQRNADMLFANIVENLPEVMDPEVHELLEGVQQHMANASSLANPISCNGSLERAIGLMEDICEILD